MLNWRRKRAWLGIFVLLFLAGFVALRLTPSLGLQRDMEAWRHSGVPTDPVELDKWYAALPVEENAALLILEAQNELVTPKKGADPTAMELPEPGHPLSPEFQSALKDYLSKNQIVLEKVHAAAGLPGSRYPAALWQGFSTLLPHLAKVKSLAQLLRLAAVQHAAHGERAEAVQAVRDGLGVARSLRDEPILISQLVRIASVAITLNGLERVLSREQLTNEEIDLLAADLEKAEGDGRNGMYRGLVGERAIGSQLFKGGFKELVALGGTPSSPNFGQDLLGGSAFMLYKISGLRDRDARFYLRIMTGFITATTNDFPRALEMADETENEMTQTFGRRWGSLRILSRMLLPALGKALRKEAVLDAQLRAARVALAVERFRGQHQRLPSSFQELDIEVPRDPFDDQPLRYERKDSGYQIAAEAASKEAGSKNNPIIGISVAR